jgi:lipopolysaccharide transport system permease protein
MRPQALALGGEARPEPPVHHHDQRAGLLREVWEYRELFYFLAWRDVKVRYKQTALGVLWAIIQPLLTMCIFTLLFGRLANIPTDGVPPALFYLTALLPWIYVSTTVNNTGMSLVGNSSLLTKIYFPRLILPASAALGGLLDFLIGSLLMIGVIAWYHVPLGWSLLIWPLLVLLMLLLALGTGMFLAALNVKYRDVKYAIPFAIQLWLFITPIIYPTSMVPERFRWLLALNPLSGLIDGFRDALIASRPIHWDELGTSSALTLVLFVGALTYFKRTERAFADIV